MCIIVAAKLPLYTIKNTHFLSVLTRGQNSKAEGVGGMIRHDELIYTRHFHQSI